ncbi:hypothetical protein ruthe_01786 [Rubellimicrobium thermophilum DSM 16684]|uniref:Uncharacterized protein n=1 Tax=Rubellimicrobium thermophilum DSM 16684 TaxID=1123069 RepID=S9SFZ1_9RHOB|nr:hypothetical protein [Rubellimicrobium thermophilum]EPX85194.1 hypothetical protein ruthe_01786 [Rubellimicrobium thermophilum DSM 16684]
MDTDLVFVAGILLLVLGFPALVSAMADGRRPRGGDAARAAGGGLVMLAVWQRPGHYALRDIPDIILHVIGRLL